MELFYAILGSGSSANSYFFKYGDRSLIVDNGYSCREFEKRLDMINCSPELINYIFVTHSHSDHLKGVRVLSRKYSIPVYSHSNLRIDKVYDNKCLDTSDEYLFDWFNLRTFQTYHDAVGSIGFSFLINGLRFTIITDTGKTSTAMLDIAKDSDIVFLESNYDKSMLINGDYHEKLKTRILSDEGHLSNDDSLYFANEISKSGDAKTKIIYLCHLSGNNNDEEIVRDLFKSKYKGSAKIIVCKKNELKIGEML